MIFNVVNDKDMFDGLAGLKDLVQFLQMIMHLPIIEDCITGKQDLWLCLTKPINNSLINEEEE
jgi:hypothetical protein